MEKKQYSTLQPSGLKWQTLGWRQERRDRAEAKEHWDRAWIKQVRSKQKAVFNKVEPGKEGPVGEKFQYIFYWQKLVMQELQATHLLFQWMAQIHKSLQETALQVLEVKPIWFYMIHLFSNIFIPQSYTHQNLKISKIQFAQLKFPLSL